MNAIKVCRECQMTSDSDRLVSPCDCIGERAYIHYQCLKTLVEVKGQLKCGYCGQNWMGIEIVKKRKGFTDFLEEESIKMEFLLSLFGLIAGILIIVIMATIFEQDHQIPWIILTKTLIYLSNVILICITFSFITWILIKFKTWRKSHFQYSINEWQVIDISLQSIAC